MKKTIGWLFAFLFLATAVLPVYAADADAEAAYAAVLGRLVKDGGADSVKAWVAGGLAAGAGTTSEWAAFALARSGMEADMTPYLTSLRAYLDKNEIRGAVNLQRYALVLAACGDTVGASRMVAGTVGAQGVMSLIYGLHLLRAGADCGAVTREETVSRLCAARLPDGGWAVTGTVSVPDVTAMAIQALAPDYAADDGVRSAVDGAVQTLKKLRLPDGGFSAYGAENAESAAQVIIALCALGRDPGTDPDFSGNGPDLTEVLDAYRRADGSVSHVAGGSPDAMAEVQTLLAWTAILALRAGGPQPYDLNAAPDETAGITETEPADGTEASGKTADTDAGTTTEEITGTTSAGMEKPVEGDRRGIGIKLAACAVLILGAVILCVVLYLRGVRRFGGFFAVGVAAAVAVLLILFLKITSGQMGTEMSALPPGGSVTLTVTGPDGVMIGPRQVQISEGGTVLDALLSAAGEQKIEVSWGGGYVSGIGGVYEFDRGPLAGWVYTVNGETVFTGCSKTVLKDGDTVEWHYSEQGLGG